MLIIVWNLILVSWEKTDKRYNNTLLNTFDIINEY